MRRRTPGRINHQQQLKQVIGRRKRALDQKDVIAPDGLQQVGLELAVAEALHHHLAERLTVIVSDLLRQVLGLAPREQFDVVYDHNFERKGKDKQKQAYGGRVLRLRAPSF